MSEERWARWGADVADVVGAAARHLLLVVVLAVNLLVAVEAGGLQGLLAGRTLHTLLMPEAVVETQQEAVGDDALAALTHRLGARGSSCNSDPHTSETVSSDLASPRVPALPLLQRGAAPCDPNQPRSAARRKKVKPKGHLGATGSTCERKGGVIPRPGKT